MIRKCGPRGALTGPGEAQSGQRRCDQTKGANTDPSPITGRETQLPKGVGKPDGCTGPQEVGRGKPDGCAGPREMGRGRSPSATGHH